MSFQMDLKWNITQNMCAARPLGQIGWLKLVQHKGVGRIGNQCQSFRGAHFLGTPLWWGLFSCVDFKFVLFNRPYNIKFSKEVV